MKRWIAGLLAGLTMGLCVSMAMASRNSAGTYSLYTPGNPVISGTPISSTAFNNTMNDIATEMSNSLDRTGRGGMTAALRGIDGSAAAPALSFTSEPGTGLYKAATATPAISANGTLAEKWTASACMPQVQVQTPDGSAAAPAYSFASETTSGLYRVGANDVAIDVGGSKIQEWVPSGSRIVDGSVSAPAYSFSGETGSGLFRAGLSNVKMSVGGTAAESWTASGVSIPGTLGVSSTLSPSGGFAQTASGTATTIPWTLFAPSLANGNTIQMNLGVAANTNQAGTISYTPNATAALNTECLGIFGVSASIACIDGNQKTTLNGALQIGSSGTAISASYRNSAAWTPGSIAAGSCVSTPIVIASATAGTECAYGFDDAPPAANNNQKLNVSCSVDHSGNCNIRLCNNTAGALTGYSGTYSCRVFNP